MDVLQQSLFWAGSVVLLATFSGLLARRSYRHCYTFAIYIAAVVVPQIFEVAWPERFYQRDVWLLKETVHNVLKFGIALELSYRIFRAFPGAFAAGEKTILMVLTLSYAAVVALPVSDLEYTRLVGEIMPRILNGTVWLFTAITALILWYRLPVHPLQKAILLGFVPYLLAFTAGMYMLHSFGWEVRQRVNHALGFIYLAVTLYWAWAAWRPDTRRPRVEVAASTPAPGSP